MITDDLDAAPRYLGIPSIRWDTAAFLPVVETGVTVPKRAGGTAVGSLCDAAVPRRLGASARDTSTEICALLDDGLLGPFSTKAQPDGMEPRSGIETALTGE